MTSMKCPQCGLINWSTAEACKRCRLPFNQDEPVDSNYSDQAPDSYQNEPGQQWSGDDGFQRADYSYRGYADKTFTDMPKKTGLAIASMVVGIASMMACGLLGLGSITGLTLGIVALVKAKNHPLKYGGQGFAIAGIVLSVFSFVFIGIVFAIAIPNLLASRRAANEGSAMYNLKQLAIAESTYQSTAGSGKFGTLQQLAGQGLIDAQLARGVKNRYIFEIKIGDTTFEALATPMKDDEVGGGGRSFYISSKELFIRAARKGGMPASAYDPPLGEDNEPRNRQTYENERARPALNPAYQN